MGQLRGSHSIAQLSDIVIALQRSITSGDNISELVVLKNRFNGLAGPAGLLSFDKETGRLVEAAASPTKQSAPITYDDF
jgi:twinkle protein